MRALAAAMRARPGLRRPATLLTAIAIALAAALAVAVAVADRPARGASMPTSPEIEREYGVRFTMVGVTADHGLLDVRFIVLDPDRAAQMLSDPSHLPRLVVERVDKALPSAALMPMHHELIPGRTYYVLYRNSGGAVHSGDKVTLAFDLGSLRHVVAN